MHLLIRAAIAAVITLIAVFSSASIDAECERCDGITIASWNVQNLGPTKLSDGRAEEIASRIAHHDIILIQEITDASGAAGAYLCAYFTNHSCIVSERTGRGTRKEQYLIASRFGLENATLIEHEALERGVFFADTDIGYRSITLATAHLKPDDVPAELEALEDILTQPVILGGDLNSDCRYLPQGTQAFLMDLHWIISDRHDTTVAQSRCAYDRFVVSSDALELIKGFRIEHVPSQLSDHHIITLIID